MTITNDERREVAARLREKHYERQGMFEPQCIEIQASNRLYDLLECLPERRDMFLVLADLIEPEPEKENKFCIPEGYLIIPDPTKNPYDPHFQVDQFASVEDYINTIVNAVMRAEQNAIVMESLERAGFVKRETCHDFGCSACGYCCDLPEPNYCPNCGSKVIY